MKTSLAIVLSVILAIGVIAASQLGAQTTTLPDSTPTTGVSAGVPIAATIATVQNIVEITRVVPAGTTAVNAFTVPAGLVLVVTDVVMTNTGTAASCGGAVNRAGTTAAAPTVPTPATPPAISTGPTAATSPTTATSPVTATAPAASATPTGSAGTTTVAGTLTQTDSTVTGPLCVAAQTTTTLPLTTGIEFGAGQSVQLLNAPDAASVGGATASSLGFHLRGVLVTLG